MKFIILRYFYFIKKGASKVVLYKLLYQIAKKFSMKCAEKFLYKKHNAINDYLERIWKQINKPSCVNKISKDNHSKTIWVLWWQGEETMPKIVSICVERLKQMTPEWNVVFLSKYNINKYINIPDYILNKIGNAISYTHLSDVVRITLLATYGGFWIDSTIFLTRPIPSEIELMNFFTIRNKPRKMLCVSMSRWSGNFIYAAEDNVLIKKMYTLMLGYWKTNDYLIDYFLIDYIINYLYISDAECRFILDNVPISNPEMYGGLIGILLSKEKIDVNKVNELVSSTWVHKLSWKEDIEKDRLQQLTTISLNNIYSV